MIHFTHVTKSYEDNWKALNNVTFRVNKGEFVFLTGHSGAGYDSKSTPDSKIQAFRRKMGIIFQDFKLLPDRNVFENVALALRIVGTPADKINKIVFDALTLVGISQKRFAMPYTLSGGEQQRVAIARAMVHNPYVLLADEPTGNLDPKNAEEVFSIFKEINARGTTVVMATHNPDFYLNSPFRRLVLDHGELLTRDMI